MADLEAQRAEVAEKLASLRMAPDIDGLVRQADKAVADYKQQAAALEAQLNQIDAQIGARARGQREEAEQQRQRDWIDKKKLLLQEQESHLRAVADAEAACRALVNAVDRVIATNGRMAALTRALSVNSKVPSALNPMELVSRMAGRIASVMGTIQGHRNRLGPSSGPAGRAVCTPRTEFGVPKKRSAWRRGFSRCCKMEMER